MPNRSDRGGLWGKLGRGRNCKAKSVLDLPGIFISGDPDLERQLIYSRKGKLLAWEIKWGKPGKNKAFTSAYATEVVYVTSENPLVRSSDVLMLY